LDDGRTAVIIESGAGVTGVIYDPAETGGDETEATDGNTKLGCGRKWT